MLLVKNAKIWGKDKLQGILIDKEKIIEILDSDVLCEKYQNIKIYDAKGRRVIPGLNDSHLHLISYAKLNKQLRLNNAKSITEVIDFGREYLKANPNTKVLIGKLYNDNNFIEKRILVKEDLDKISTDIPIIFSRVCGHICTINSKAIDVLGLNPDIKVPGGTLDVKDGKLTGVLRENAMNLREPIYNKDNSVESYKRLIIDAIKDANKVGLTSLQVNDINGDIEEAKMIFNAYVELANEGKLNARINHQITFEDVNVLDTFLKFAKFRDDYLKVGPLKLFIDGSLGAKTAALFDNYLDDTQNGIICLSEVNLTTLVDYATSNNLQVIIHAIGDRGISIVLDEFARVNKGQNDNRNGIVHVQITSKEILERFKELQVCALVQPIFINTDMFMVYDRVSKDLGNTSYAFNTLYKTTPTSFGSDAPVEGFNPFLNIYHAVTRKDLSEKHSYIEEEALSVEDSINAYTYNSAFMSFEESFKGKIEVGYLADLVVLDKDPYMIIPTMIKDINVDCTIVGGRIVYEK